jgi:hypothetical protein
MTFTITQANENDTMTGTLIYTLSDDVRQKIAERAGKSRSQVAAKIRRSGMTAVFKPGTACPVLRLEVQDPWLEVEGIKVNFQRLNLEIFETAEEMPQLLCTWTRQLNTKRQRRGVIAAINRLISPEP